MALPHGYFDFPGLRDIVSASFTMTPGVSPNVAAITSAPKPNMKLRIGDLTIGYGSTRITLRDCTIDRVTAGVSDNGEETWTFSILDRRWRWRKGGAISGVYNRRLGDTSEVDPDTEQSPRDLARLCFREMDERNYDVSQMLNSDRPEIQWDYTLPSLALSNLADDVGCVVVLGLDDVVRVVPKNWGTEIPPRSLAISYSATLDPPETPREIICVGAITRYQVDVDLEPVGLDVDGEVKPINDLSYAPENAPKKTPWAIADVRLFNCVSNSQARELARESVFRWYRIKTPITIPGRKEKITDLDRVLPIENSQVELQSVLGEKHFRPAWVYGAWYNYGEGGEPYTEDPDKERLKNEPNMIYPYGFSIDQKSGIVKFADPVYLTPEDDDGEYFGDDGALGRPTMPAKIKLRVAVGVRDGQTRAFERFERRRRLGGYGPAEYRRHDDVVHTLHISHDDGKLVDSKKQTDQVAGHKIDADIRDYDNKNPVLVSYPGFLVVSPTGAIQQVTWELSRSGKATTRVARQIEELHLAPSYRQKRRIERDRKYIEKTTRQKKANEEKAG